MISDIACGHISIKYGFRGLISQLFQLVLLLQMQLLTLSIILGHADVMVTGGSEAAVTIAGMGDSMPCMHCQQEMMIQQQLLDQWTRTETVLF
jgi:3-oxoacyl-(acyl-carrier-protein) synthase